MLMRALLALRGKINRPKADEAAVSFQKTEYLQIPASNKRARQIHSIMKNQIKTAALLGLLAGLMLAVGYALAGREGLTIALVIALLMNFVTYFFSDKIVLAMYGAKKTQDKGLLKLVEEVAAKAGIPAPRVYVRPNPSPNAFATGRNPKHAAVACTEGIMRLLSKEELAGVIAHELAHVKNRDILVSTIAAVMATVISYAAHMAFFSRDNENRNPISMILLMIATPLIASLIQFAISRSREYLADASGAGYLKDGKPLAAALEKLQRGVAAQPMQASPATAPLFIVNPGKVAQLFSTHPPLYERISKLKQMNF
jgi:heat shock protein HtpX